MRNYNVLVITPATVRPSIVGQTFSSFSRKMFDLVKGKLSPYGCTAEVKLAINVDLVGDTCNLKVCNTAHDIYLVAQRYFELDNLHINYDGEPSLSHSFHYLWEYASTANCDYVFYLEDDWLLLEEVDPFDMITIMEENPKLATLRLPFKPTGLKHSKNWRHFFPWTGRYFKCPNEDKDHIGWCGHPSLVNPAFIKETLPLLSPEFCPERQMKGLYGNTPMRAVINKWNYGVYGIPAGPQYVKDIGRMWRAKRGLIKLNDTSWIIKKGQTNDN